MRLRLARILMGLAITFFFLGHAIRAYQFGVINQLDRMIYDARLRLMMPGKGDERIVILDIDEKSLGEMGHWPWSRNVMAQLMDKLFDRFQVAIVGFDVVWPERDTSSGMSVLDELAQNELKREAGYQAALRQLRGKLDFDGLFAASIKGRPVVLGYYFNSDAKAARVNTLPPPVLPGGSFAGRNIAFPRWTGYTGNLPIYLENAVAAGHFNPSVDDDGLSRRVPMILEYGGAYYEPFSLAMVRTYVALQTGSLPSVEPGFPPEQPLSGNYGAMEWVRVGPYRIPVDDEAAALIPYRGTKGTFTYVSLADVLHERIEPGLLKGKIAIIGTTAPGLQDLRSTPVGSAFPGVEIHASMIAGIINHDVKSKPAFMLGAEVLLLLVGGAALSFLLPMLSPLWATLAAMLGATLITAFDFMIWSSANLVLPLATSILMTAFIYTMNMAYGYFVETRSNRQFAGLFGQYVPPELVQQMAADPKKYSMAPKAAELTILFSDVRGFTSISEALEPEDLRAYIDAYLTVMSGIIRSQYRGTLDKYIGDAIMAFWGAPVEDPQHARNGVLAGLQMQKECEVLNAKFATRGWPALKIGVGLNSGNVRVGDMGSKVRRAYTVMGDAVNVASRLEGRTKHYGVGILVGEATRNAVKDVVFREIDRIRVKGRGAALKIYEPLGLESEVGVQAREELGLWDRAQRAYRACKWDEADARLLELQRMSPACKLYTVFSGKVAEKRAAPPAPDWDGVTVFDEK